MAAVQGREHELLQEMAALKAELGQLRRDHERLRSVADNSEDALFLIRMEPSVAYEYVSPSIATLSGYSPEAFYADPDLLTRIVHPEDRGEIARVASLTGGSGVSVARWCHKAGHIVWVETRWRFILDDQGVAQAFEGSARDITATVGDAQLLLDREAQYHALFEHSPLPMVIFDTESLQLLAANTAAEKLYQFSRQEQAHLPITDVLLPEELEPIVDAVRLNSPTEPVDRGIWRHRRRDGSSIHAQVFAQPIVFQGRNARLNVILNQNERVQAEAELRFQKGLLEAQAEALPDGVLLVASDGRVLLANRRFSELWGLEVSPGTVYHTALIEQVKSKVADLPSFLAPLKEGRMQGNWQDEVRLKDGRTFERHSSEVRGADGQLYGYVRVFRDITGRKRTEDALRYSQEQLLAILGCTQGKIIEFDADGRFVRVWAGSDEVLVAPRSELLGRTLEEVLGVEPTRSFMEAVRRVLATGKSERIEYSLPFPKGERFFSGEFSPVPPQPGATPTVALFSQDVTEKKLAERERQKVQEHLLLADRMVSVGTLAAGVAHEINNPLAFVITNLHFIASELKHAARQPGVFSCDPEELLSAMRDSVEGCQRMKQIVRDLKTFSRANETTTAPVDLRRVADAAISMAWNEIRHRAQLVRDFRPVEEIEANESRLGQVILNLLVNAAQAIKEGAAEQNQIRVSIHPREGGGVELAVSDTGCGIPPEVQARMFDPFFTTKPIGVGTGLGLSICQSIVHGMGGRIRVQSEVGGGTTITVELPGRNAPAQPERRVASTPPPPTRRGRLLIIDDERAVGEALRRILQAVHEVEFVPQARTALELVRAGQRFDLLLCDLMMPDLTGMDLYEELRALAPEQARRMIFMTGGAFTPAAREFFEKHAAYRLEKPFDPDAVLRTVDVALEALAGAERRAA